MREVTFKYNIGDTLKFKEDFDSSASDILFDLAGTTRKVVDRCVFSHPAYKLEGLNDSWFTEDCFVGLS